MRSSIPFGPGGGSGGGEKRVEKTIARHRTRKADEKGKLVIAVIINFIIGHYFMAIDCRPSIMVTPQGLTISTRCLDLIMVEGQDLM